jgi:GDP-D-mannose dehydratase
MYQNFKVIIFGSNGQDGFYLGKLLKEKKSTAYAFHVVTQM